MFDKLVNRLRVAWWGFRGGVRYAFKRSLEEWRKQNSDLLARQMLATTLLVDLYSLIAQTLLDKKPEEIEQLVRQMNGEKKLDPDLLQMFQ
jgi:hypothetical protein